MSTSQDYLKQAAAAWFFHRTQRRDALLEIGRLLHLYILEAMRERDRLRTCKQKENGTRRRQLIQQAAKKLDVRCGVINQIVGAAMVVKLLSSGGNVGELSFYTIQLFHCIIRRKGRRAGSKRPSTRGKTYTILGTWEPRFRAAPELFRRAVREVWSQEKTKHELREFREAMGKTLQTQCKREPVHSSNGKTTPAPAEQPHQRTGEYHGPRNSDDEPAKRIAGVVSACSPRDAADVIYQTILENDDPKALAGHLVRMLSDRQFARDVRERELEAQMA